MNILNYQECLAFPEPGQGPEISPEGEAMIRALLTEPDVRLGARGGIKEIKAHPFFADFPWDHILRETPPFVPELDGIDDHSYFSVAPTQAEAQPGDSGARCVCVYICLCVLTRARTARPASLGCRAAPRTGSAMWRLIAWARARAPPTTMTRRTSRRPLLARATLTTCRRSRRATLRTD